MTFVQGGDVGRALIKAGVVTEDAGEILGATLTVPGGSSVVTLSLTLVLTAEKARQFAKALRQATMRATMRQHP